MKQTKVSYHQSSDHSDENFVRITPTYRQAHYAAMRGEQRALVAPVTPLVSKQYFPTMLGKYVHRMNLMKTCISLCDNDLNTTLSKYVTSHIDNNGHLCINMYIPANDIPVMTIPPELRGMGSSSENSSLSV